MIRDLGEQYDGKNLKISVYLKDGRKFLYVDPTPDCFGKFELIVSFWVGDTVMVHPMESVEHVEFHLDSREVSGNAN